MSQNKILCQVAILPLASLPLASLLVAYQAAMQTLERDLYPVLPLKELGPRVAELEGNMPPALRTKYEQNLMALIATTNIFQLQ